MKKKDGNKFPILLSSIHRFELETTCFYSRFLIYILYILKKFVDVSLCFRNDLKCLNTFSIKRGVEKIIWKKEWHEEKKSVKKAMPAEHNIHALAKIICHICY